MHSITVDALQTTKVFRRSVASASGAGEAGGQGRECSMHYTLYSGCRESDSEHARKFKVCAPAIGSTQIHALFAAVIAYAWDSVSRVYEVTRRWEGSNVVSSR